MGLTESTIKTITEPFAHLVDNCGHSDFKSKCCQCLEIEIDTHTIDSLPGLSTIQAKDNSRDRILSNVTLLAEK